MRTHPPRSEHLLTPASTWRRPLSYAILLLIPLISLIYGGVWLSRQSAERTAAREMQAHLRTLTPRVNRVLALEKATQSNQSLVAALHQWRRTRPVLYPALLELVELTPNVIQLRNFTFISAPDKLSTDPRTPWDRSLDIQGSAAHQKPEEIIAVFCRELSDADNIRRLSPSLRLLSFSRTSPDVQTNEMEIELADFLISGNNLSVKRIQGNSDTELIDTVLE